MRKILVLLFTLSLVLPLSLIFTNQASASTTIGTVSWSAGNAPYLRNTTTYLETEYITSVTGTLEQVNLGVWRYSIPVGTPLMTNADFLACVCEANGVSLGVADSIAWPYQEVYGWGSLDYGVLTWNCSQAIVAAGLVFEFNNTFIQYRQSKQSGAPETADLNGDGNYSLYEHSVLANFGDGICNNYTLTGASPSYNEVGLSFVMGGAFVPPAPPVVPPAYTTQTFGTISWLPNEGESIRHLTFPSLEHGSYIKQTGIIRQVDLGVWSTELIGAAKNIVPANFPNIKLWVNNIYVGTPTNITWPEVILDSNGYERAFGILTWWGLNLTANDQYTIFELRQSLSGFGGIHYRHSPIDTNGNGIVDYDLDGDGLYSMWEGNTYANGIANGLNQYNADPAYRFMIDVPDAGTGGLETLGSDGLDVQGALKQYTSLYIQYAVDSLANPYHIAVYLNGAFKTDQNLNYTIPNYFGTFVYNPQQGGPCIISIRNVTNVTISSKTITITANTESDWIQTLPPMGSFINLQRLNYKYSKDRDGIIGIFDSMADSSDLDNAINTIGGITTAGTYNLTVMPLNTAYSEGRIYYRLFANNSEPVSGVGVFVIDGVTETKLSPQYNPLLNSNVETFYYAHNFVNGKVGVFVDGTKIYDIGDQKTGSFQYTFQTGGFKEIDMRVYLGSTWVRLPEKFSLNVSASPAAIITPPSILDIREQLGPLWCAVLGLCIVIACLLIPFIINITYKTNIKVPQLAYGILGGVGIAISIVLGLWPAWVIAFMIIIAILVGVFIYVLKPGAVAE